MDGVADFRSGSLGRVFPLGICGGCDRSHHQYRSSVRLNPDLRSASDGARQSARCGTSGAADPAGRQRRAFLRHRQRLSAVCRQGCDIRWIRPVLDKNGPDRSGRYYRGCRPCPSRYPTAARNAAAARPHRSDLHRRLVRRSRLRPHDILRLREETVRIWRFALAV